METTKNVKWAAKLCQAIYSTPAVAGARCSARVAWLDLETWSRLTDERVVVWAGAMGAVRLLLVDTPRFAEKRDVYTWTAADERGDRHRRRFIQR